MINRRNLIGGFCLAGAAKALGLGEPASSLSLLISASSQFRADRQLDDQRAVRLFRRECGGWRTDYVPLRGAIWYLKKPISWRPGDGQSRYPPVVVPTGFVTDLASIPRVFWSVLRPDGEYAYAAVIHDYLYWVSNDNQTRCGFDFQVLHAGFSS